MADVTGGTVVLTWWRRPDYSILVAEALCRCWGIEDWRVLIHVEPGCSRTANLADVFPLPNKCVTHHRDRRGCDRAIFEAVGDGLRHAEFCVILEDDVVPAPDFLLYMTWCRDRYATDPAAMAACAYHPGYGAADEVFREPGFNAWGWGTWRDRWEWMADAWSFDHPAGRSWDDVLAHDARGERYSVQPRLSRTQNIGAEGGTHHCDVATHERLGYNPRWAGPADHPVRAYREL